MDDKTKRETLRWVRKTRRDVINNAVLLVDHLDTLEAMLNE